MHVGITQLPLVIGYMGTFCLLSCRSPRTCPWACSTPQRSHATTLSLCAARCAAPARSSHAPQRATQRGWWLGKHHRKKTLQPALISRHCHQSRPQQPHPSSRQRLQLPLSSLRQHCRSSRQPLWLLPPSSLQQHHKRPLQPRPSSQHPRRLRLSSRLPLRLGRSSRRQVEGWLLISVHVHMWRFWKADHQFGAVLGSACASGPLCRMGIDTSLFPPF